MRLRPGICGARCGEGAQEQAPQAGPKAAGRLALRPSNYVCACCQNGNGGTKTKVKSRRLNSVAQRGPSKRQFTETTRPSAQHFFSYSPLSYLAD